MNNYRQKILIFTDDQGRKNFAGPFLTEDILSVKDIKLYEVTGTYPVLIGDEGVVDVDLFFSELRNKGSTITEIN